VKRRTLLVLLGLSLAACGRADKARQKFEAVQAGQAEMDLRRALGDPRAMIVREYIGDRMVHVDLRNGRQTLLADDPSSWPPHAKSLPRRKIENKVLIYESGDVTAYYFMDGFGEITFASVHGG
jgi:hypothetical protein